MTEPHAPEQLRTALEACRDLAQQIEGQAFPLRQFSALQVFQRQRLAGTYEDFSQDERYREAVRFFLEELYGGLNFKERDRQLEQVLPIMERLLPAGMQAVLADAFRLQALSLELDVRLAVFLAREADPDCNLDPAIYAHLYRLIDRGERTEQIELIGRLGLELNQLVKHRSVLVLISAMRGPAHMAGFSELQQFLEQGLRAFRTMGDGLAFVQAILDRESAIMDSLYGRADQPFDI